MFNGLLRLHGRDIARMQRLLDPLVVSLLFIVFNDRALAFYAWGRLPLCLWLVFIIAIVLAQAGLYASYRSRSLLSLGRHVSFAWLLVLAALLVLSYATKSTASFSRIDTSLWAIASWLVLLINHVGLRQLLRVHRSRGGNSRKILYWGLPQAAVAFSAELHRNPWMGLSLAAWFGPQPPFPDGGNSPGLPAFGGDQRAMRRWLDNNEVDRIVFSHVTRDG